VATFATTVDSADQTTGKFHGEESERKQSRFQ